jgi:hypothetical protein
MRIRARDRDSSDPGSGMEKSRIRDPGWKKVGSGIRDKHPGSATLVPVLLLSLKSSAVLWIWIMDPDSIGSLNPYPGSRRAKKTHKHKKNY